jgi:hypothetical protein
MDCVFLKIIIMEKEDFIIGKWYTSSRWSAILAAKFSGFVRADGFFGFSEEISGPKKQFYQVDSFTTTDQRRWETFREVSLVELAKYLPPTHPDLKVLYPEYVKCVNPSTFPTLASGAIVGKVYKVVGRASSYPNSDYYLEGETKGSASSLRFIPATFEEYQAQATGQVIESDLSVYVGRYLKALVDNPDGGSKVLKGQYGLIVSSGYADFPNFKRYNCTTALSLNKDKYELMPEGFCSPHSTDVDGNNLEGRYLKALVGGPQGTLLGAGEYIKILKLLESRNSYELERDWIYTIDSPTSGQWKVMPEGWHPVVYDDLDSDGACSPEQAFVGVTVFSEPPYIPSIPKLGKSNHNKLIFIPVEVSPVKLKIINNSKYL